MKTERELFEEAFKKVNSGVSFWLNTWSDEDNDYGHLTASWGWHMWQASANRQGYKFVPVNYECVWCGCTELDGWTNEAMIGACDDH